MLALASVLRDHYDVALACPSSPGGDALLSRARELGVEARPLAPFTDPALSPGGVCSADLEWLGRFDVAHVHAGIAFEGSGPVELARAAGVSSVVRTEHQPYLVESEAQARRYAVTTDLVDVIIGVSAGVSETFVRAGVERVKVLTVRNGVPQVERVDPAPVRARLGLDPARPVVLTPARFAERKGYRYLFEAALDVAALRPDALFVWAGTGPIRDEMRDLVASSSVRDHVVFLPGTDAIADLLAVSDVLVLPSFFEGMPLVVLEAMSVGVPVVATDVCGTNEVVDDGLTGRLVPARDAAMLAAGVLEALAPDGPAPAWAAAGLEEYLARGTVGHMAGDTMRVYTSLGFQPLGVP